MEPINISIQSKNLSYSALESILKNVPRDTLRELARKHNAFVGQDKEDVINNLSGNVGKAGQRIKLNFNISIT